MKQWEGIRSDTEATGNGCSTVVNASFIITGELSRRYGMVNALSKTGTAITQFHNPLVGYFAILATSTGTVEAEATP